MQSLNVIPVVLAGGKSSRMGTDKRFLLVQEKSWLEHSVGLLKQVTGRDSVIVSGEAQGMDSIPDIRPGQGPLMGLYSVMTYLWSSDSTEKWILIVPVDMPKLMNETLRQLVAVPADVMSGVEIIGFQDRELPLLIRLNEFMLDRLEGLLKEIGKKRSFRNLIGVSKTRFIKKATENEFLNFNSPADLELL